MYVSMICVRYEVLKMCEREERCDDMFGCMFVCVFDWLVWIR